MLFTDKLQEKHNLLQPEIDRLLEVAWKNQAHKGDLLLFHVNGFYDDKILEYNLHSERKLNPHLIGPNWEGYSEQAHYNFIDNYRTNSSVNVTHSQFLEDVKWAPEKKDQIKKLNEIEEMSIQLEMLIYLKFWEADMTIKKLYQFVRILNGESYDWYFKIAESSRDKKCTGTRQDIIRLKIRDKLKEISPILYKLIDDTYKTQIRNSIAHSQYSFLNRTIGLNNFIKEDPASQIYGVPFDDWINLFHNTIILHNEYVRMGIAVNEHYARVASQNSNYMEILINEKNGKKYPLYLEYRPVWKDWKYWLPDSL